MKLLSISCSQCGAPLEVPKHARLLTCTYCQARLKVERTGSDDHAELVESVDERTRQIAEDVSELKLQQQLEQLDREWMLERDQLKVRGKNGEFHVPSVAGSLIGAGFAAVFGIFWVSMTMRMGGRGLFPLIGVLVTLFAVAACAMSLSKASAYQRGRQRYERRRHQLIRQLQHDSEKAD